jgi:hypothetical protein
LEVSAENLQSLFSKGGLGKFKTDKKICCFHASKFEIFCSKFMIQDVCETTQCKVKVKGLNTEQWFVRLGTKYYGDLCKPGTKDHAPRVQNSEAAWSTPTFSPRIGSIKLQIASNGEQYTWLTNRQ